MLVKKTLYLSVNERSHTYNWNSFVSVGKYMQMITCKDTRQTP